MVDRRGGQYNWWIAGARVVSSIEFLIFRPSKSARTASKLPVYGFKLAVFPVYGKYGTRIFCPKSARIILLTTLGELGPFGLDEILKQLWWEYGMG